MRLSPDFDDDLPVHVDIICLVIPVRSCRVELFK
jgi:hypothetical protein